MTLVVADSDGNGHAGEVAKGVQVSTKLNDHDKRTSTHDAVLAS